MNISELTWKNCRNLSSGSFCPDPELNVIWGDNGQGKTNLLEWIWIFTGGHSFRGAKDSDLISFLQPRACANLRFFAQQRSQTAEIAIFEGKRSCKLNDVPLKSAIGLVGNFCASVFAPGDLSLVQDGPAQRRRFLDTALCQLHPLYARALSRYNRVIEQRNALLKEIAYRPAREELLCEWDEQAARLGAVVEEARIRFLRELQPATEKFYQGISDGKEKLSLSGAALSSEEMLTTEKWTELLLDALNASRAADLAAGVTTTGPHRDDFSVQINGISARTYGSQGQQRSAVLALKLGEATVLENRIGEKPVVLLDDVMSELDAGRQDFLLSQLKGWQVFITCCDPAAVLRMSRGKAFRMQAGVLYAQPDGDDALQKTERG